jgi:hypothetical protein
MRSPDALLRHLASDGFSDGVMCDCRVHDSTLAFTKSRQSFPSYVTHFLVHRKVQNFYHMTFIHYFVSGIEFGKVRFTSVLFIK